MSSSRSLLLLGNLFGRSDSPPRKTPSTGFKPLDTVEKLEEENWEWYSVDAYYPVQIGETFRSRYQILESWVMECTPPHGSAATYSTAHQYVTLKVCERGSQSAEREVAVYKHLDSIHTKHLGALLIRRLLDSFTITVPGGDHLCLVHEPLGMSVETLAELMPGRNLSEDVLKSVLKHLLLALDCLHSEGSTIHTDLQAGNIHFRVEDQSIFQDYETNERKNPSPRKVSGDRIIYESRGLKLPNKTGPPVLCDFGEARFGKASYTDDIQPYVYRAPEVILDIPWSYEVDIWNVGVLIWDLFEGQHLFSARGPSGDQLSEYHLAEMYAILGPPPLDYLQRTETSWDYFAKDGTWKASTSIPNRSLETLERRLRGEVKTQFLDFLRKMLQWKPESRYTAKQLLEDPWLKD